MEIAPDPRQAAILSWRIRLRETSGRARKLRLTSFCEVAGHETGAYARDLDFAGMHVETIFVRALNTIFARNRLLRSARADRGETSFFSVMPGVGSRTRRATRIRAPASSAKARSPRRPGASRGAGDKLDDEGKLWTFDPAASFTLDVRLPANGMRGCGVHRRPLRQQRLGGRTRRAPARLCRRCRRPISKRASTRRARSSRRTRWPTRWPFAFSDDGKTLRPHPSHAAPVGACDGQRARHGDDGLERRRGLLGLRQCPPERADARSSSTARPSCSRGRSSICATSIPARPTRPASRRSSARPRPIDAQYEPGVATFSKTRGGLATTYTIFVPARPPLRHAASDLAQHRRQAAALPRRAVLRHRARREPERERRQDRRGDGRDDTHFPQPDQRFRARLRLRRDEPRSARSSRRSAARFFGGPGRDIHTPVDGRNRGAGRRGAR